MLTAIETTGTISAGHQIDLDEKDWLRYVSNNSVFDFLYDETEDIYMKDDGKPLSD